MEVKFSFSEIDIIIILNSLSYFLGQMSWEDDPKQKRVLSRYVNFSNKIEYCEYYNNLINIHRRISLKSNRKIYKRKNNIFFIGQADYICNKSFFRFKLKMRKSIIK